MAVTFEKRPHNLLPGVEVVDILVNGVLVATIAPQSDGDGIKLTSAHFAGDLAKGTAFPAGIKMDNGQGSMPPIPAVLIAFRPRPFHVEGNRIVRTRAH